MVNTIKKGYRIERKAREVVLRQGYQIMFKSMRTRFGCQDFAHLFDIVAFKEQTRIYISVKSFINNSHHNKDKEEVRQFAIKYGLPNEFFCLWLYVPRGCWKTIAYSHLGLIIGGN